MKYEITITPEALAEAKATANHHGVTLEHALGMLCHLGAAIPASGANGRRGPLSVRAKQAVTDAEA